MPDASELIERIRKVAHELGWEIVYTKTSTESYCTRWPIKLTPFTKVTVTLIERR